MRWVRLNVAMVEVKTVLIDGGPGLSFAVYTWNGGTWSYKDKKEETIKSHIFAALDDDNGF